MLQAGFEGQDWGGGGEPKYKKLPKKAISNLTEAVLFLKVEIPVFTTQSCG